MQLRILLALLAACLMAQTQTMTVARLMDWLRNPATAKESDTELAGFLAKVKLADRLDDRAIESLRGQGVVLGSKTMDALHRLRDQSRNLPEAAASTVSTGLKAPPIPSAEEQAAILGEVRQYALEYSQKLPDFICYEREQRWAAPARPGRGGDASGEDPDWRTQDTIVKKLTYFQQKEEEKVLQHNNQYTTKDMKSLGGARSIGDFGTMLRQIFEPETAARFEWGRWGRVGADQLVMTFNFAVPLERSQYHLEVEGRDIVTAYHGSVRLDGKTHAVLRVAVEADGIPPDFPLTSASDTIDYGYQTISNLTFLLPLQADVRMGASDHLTRNVKQYINYSKYSADVSISYDGADLPPLPGNKAPDDKSKETVLPGQPVKVEPPPPAKKGG
jgi:hypothetical protein